VSYTIDVTPSWTSVPEPVTIETFKTVTPTILTESYTTTVVRDDHTYIETLITPVTVTPSVEV